MEGNSATYSAKPPKKCHLHPVYPQVGGGVRLVAVPKSAADAPTGRATPGSPKGHLQEILTKVAQKNPN